MDGMTIGKRIQTLRKEKNLTQEQLAEQIGVSAQAVSKWENDYSCPDISILPKLAEVLGVSTDTLLGVETLPVPPQTPQAPDGERKGKDFWPVKGLRFSGKLSGILVGLFLLTLGVLLLLIKLHEEWFPCGYWQLVWPVAIFFAGLNVCLRRRTRVVGTGLVLLGAYALLSNLRLITYPITWPIILAILLILFGAWAVFKQFFCRPVAACARCGSSKHADQFGEEDGFVTMEGSFGVYSRAFSGGIFQGGDVSISFGEGTLDLRQAASCEPNTQLEVSVAFGKLVVFVPPTMRVVDNTNQSFSSVSNNTENNAGAQDVLTLSGSVSFGDLQIQ